MDETSASPPSLCEKGCGFFANIGCGGFCSKCHREMQRVAQAATAGPSRPSAEPAAFPKRAQEAQSPPVPSVQSPAPEPEAPSGSGSGDAPKTRCLECKKKVGLTGFKCKCGGLFCGQHRYAESHTCAFDYKGAGKEKLASSNPVVQASKIAKI
ncbi:Zinc finger A20 and AN1 domain-containing stress-associated protein 9 [Tetrabaena socialis]|uniref:Zinc finger A20 and AN1 domain-containing stress-associated protein 9 n=1 Tax=Tetrabaena socialis TaxID=47790 RepID=A0A2J8A480_9CHLO|nr:Zinc finger A20 and AN1 domain-containing stress-associated protein 9 [Tetrabaena socialis]|eukprot:PNH07324.1 Zinc finger A20 and AN1 domain-containing stress-associated protein 9 [Tetrabaena socialis]